MAITNSERIGKALDVLHRGLSPFVEREMRVEFGDKWIDELAVNKKIPITVENGVPQDVSILLSGMWDNWNIVFKKTLGISERSLVSEIRDIRNRWAHKEKFSSDDTYRALDSMERMLRSISAPESQQIESMRQEVMRLKFDEQARYERRKTTEISLHARRRRSETLARDRHASSRRFFGKISTGGVRRRSGQGA